ncbi:MAG: putative lipid II flippase FtsW [Planctomycetes bacterium]|nr:putative lipid II flippase FtsW [Planctomycetota bacterium]
MSPKNHPWLARLISPAPCALEPFARAAVTCALVLMGLGVLMVYSASSTKAGLRYDDPELFLRRQVMWVLGGVVTLWFTMRTDPERIRRWAKPATIGIIFLLVVVLVPGIGTLTNGARRWFRLGSLSFQPSEAAKLILVVWLSHHLSVAAEKLDDWKEGVLPAVVPMAVAAGVVLVEPDFGTSLFVVAVCSAMMLVAGLPWRKLAICGIAGIPLVIWQVVKRWDVMARRFSVMGGTDAHSDAQHQVHQAKIALGSGGLTGVGLGASRQKLLYLPEAHTDFILPVLGEELGFAGTALVVGLFAAFVFCGLRIAMGCAGRERSSFLLAFGVTFMIGLQAAGNVAVVTGSVPTKGIALPFISLGGSSLLVLCAGLGLLYAEARRHDLAMAKAMAERSAGANSDSDADGSGVTSGTTDAFGNGAMTAGGAA